MKNKNELNFKDLKMTCNEDIFNFKTTAELSNITTGIGQERGIKALEFGIDVNIKGVIYIATYKTDEEKDTYVNSLLMCLDDWKK